MLSTDIDSLPLRGALAAADHQRRKNETEKQERKVNVLIKRQHKHYSNSDILCLMAKYSLGLLIFKQFSKVFFYISVVIKF